MSDRVVVADQRTGWKWYVVVLLLVLLGGYAIDFHIAWQAVAELPLVAAVTLYAWKQPRGLPALWRAYGIGYPAWVAFLLWVNSVPVSARNHWQQLLSSSEPILNVVDLAIEVGGYTLVFGPALIVVWRLGCGRELSLVRYGSRRVRVAAYVTFLTLLMIGAVARTAQQAMGQAQVPGQTQADKTLQGDILKYIRLMQQAYAPNCSYEIVDTKSLGVQDNAVLEEWVIRSCSSEVVYPIRLTPADIGGTHFTVSTPNAYVNSQNPAVPLNLNHFVPLGPHIQRPALFAGTYQDGGNVTNPRPQHSKYLETDHGGVTVVDRGAGFYLNLKIREQPSKPLYIRITWPNPGNLSDPLVNDAPFDGSYGEFRGQDT